MAEPTAAIDVCAAYVSALAERDAETIAGLRAEDAVFDLVHLDAYESGPVVGAEATQFWPTWFLAFGDLELDVERTFVAAEAVVMQWTFLLTNNGPLQPPLVPEPRPATEKTIRFRGVAVFDVEAGLIRRETIYFDYATLWTELGGTR